MYDRILDNMTWSFSRVNNYCTCPHVFKLLYIDKKPQINNAFAEFGRFVHSLLELYFKGKVEFFELSQIYEDEYNLNVLHEFPEFEFCNLAKNYYEGGINYLNSFEGIDDNLQVVGVEQKVNLTINGRPFVGYIDLILQDKTDGKYIIIDHKSKSKFKSKKEREHYFFQLYLYSLYIKDTFGEYPKELRFNMFRIGKLEIEQFDSKKLKKALNWFNFTIDLIYFDTEFIKMKNQFYCENLCSVRDVCKKGE
jgi:CRISPR/Cas system-associated exonuclease Cas4 (RecB family)